MFIRVKPAPEYSYESVQQKINDLADKDYTLVGTIPEDFIPWPNLKLGVFLFTKNNEYYQYNASSLLFNSELNIKFNSRGEPIIKRHFRKITNNDFIHLIFTKREWVQDNPNKRIVILRENASISGHKFLMRNPEIDFEVIAGEIYFAQSKLLLINPKSGGFHTEINEAMDMVKIIFGTAGEMAFSAAIEKNEVDAEIERRKAIIIQPSNNTPIVAKWNAPPDPLPYAPCTLFAQPPSSHSAILNDKAKNNPPPTCCIMM